MEHLKRKKRALKAKLTSTINRFELVEKDEIAINKFLEILSGIQHELDSLNDEMIALATDEELEAIINDYDTEIARLHETQITMERSKQQLIGLKDKESSLESTGQTRLPQLDLPRFDGDVRGWLTFADIFKASVTDNTALSDGQKLQYLKGCLRGRAADMLQYLPVTNQNFSKAWDILVTRYENKRLIVEAYIDKLLDYNPGTLDQLLDLVQNTCGALEALHLPVEHWDAILYRIAYKKLDLASQEAWSLHYTGREVPQLSQLLQFIQSRMAGLKNLKTCQTDSSQSATSAKCYMCKKAHALLGCGQFKELSIKDRRKLLTDNGICFNCLKKGHNSINCTATGRCKTCNGKHHTLIHQKIQETDSTTKVHHIRQESHRTLLPTALINVTDKSGKQHVVRALLDTGAQASFITKRCAKRIQLETRQEKNWVRGLASKTTKTNQTGILRFTSRTNQHVKMEAKVYILENITKLEGTSVTQPIVQGLELADPEYYMGHEIDVLLGADIFSELLVEGIKNINKGPVAQNTKLGWVIFGTTQGISSPLTVANTCHIESHYKDYETENTTVTSEEKEVEELFRTTHRRLPSGRYMVRLPWKEECKVGESRKQAMSRLLSLEKQLGRKHSLRKEYNRVMKEYIELGHMELVPTSDKNNSNVFYIPHQAVIKETSKTTKLRVVFDASAKTSSGYSMNNNLKNGPKIQDDIIPMLLRYRTKKVALCCDAIMMYRQVQVHPEDADKQRILWRTHPDKRIMEYRLLTLTFGTKPAPFLATRVIQQLAADEFESYPEASRAIKEDMYVDDVMTGTDSVQEARILKTQLTQIMKAGGFEMHKWASNEPSIITEKPEMRTIAAGVEEEQRVLGIHWDPKEDYFFFKVKATPNSRTKRELLADIAKLYDPLGFLAPITIRGKILFQELWKETLGWDDELPTTYQRQLEQYKEDLANVTSIKIPRYAGLQGATKHSLYGFCDASEKAYGAVVYLHSENSKGDRVTQMLIAKSRVAPLKTTTIPRLELSAAVLLAETINKVKSSLKMQIDNTYAWTDSQIVLAWLAAHPSRWDRFVAHRIARIQEILPRRYWSHISSKQNPADSASRGITVKELHNNTLWWNGPTNIQIPKPENLEDNQKAMNSQSVLVTQQPKNTSTLLQRYSSLRKLLRITALLRRFRHNCTQRTNERKTGHITAEEREQALRVWIQATQGHAFPEIKQLQKSLPLPKSSRLKSLDPFLDENGIIRVGGRLENSSLTPDQKHPVILPGESTLARLIIQQIHEDNYHSGIQLTESLVRLRFWILRGKQTTKKVIRDCIRCRKAQAQGLQPKMGNLPRLRLEEASPFTHCGVDYAGPMNLRTMLAKGSRTYKAYIAIFVCFATKALHLEIVSNLTTDAFLAALRRFIARRGKPTTIHSDNGTTFVGAEKELKKAVAEAQRTLENTAADLGISWKFNPPQAPNFGGLWEAGVKSVKTHLRKTVGKNLLTFEEMTTVITQIEAILNSRPLCELSTDPKDLESLTPGHFLIGRPLVAHPEQDLTDTAPNRLKRWQLVQQIQQHFWKRWKTEYLTRLQQRNKWQNGNTNLTPGELVLLRNNTGSPTIWTMARILSIHKGKDGHARVATIYTNTGTYTRPVSSLCRLSDNINSTPATAHAGPGEC